jgi:uncharacterized protein
MPAPVTHFEINLRDVKAGQEFYETLFGWSVSYRPEMKYGMIDTGVKGGILGGLGGIPEEGKPSVVFYVRVDDLQACLYQAVKLGGSVVLPVTEVPGGISIAQFSDLEGNVIGLLNTPDEPMMTPEPVVEPPTRPAARPAPARPKPEAKSKAKPKAKSKAKPKARPKPAPKVRAKSNPARKKRR